MVQLVGIFDRKELEAHGPFPFDRDLITLPHLHIAYDGDTMRIVTRDPLDNVYDLFYLRGVNAAIDKRYERARNLGAEGHLAS